MTTPLKDVRQHQLWVALEAGSGIVPQHDYDPEGSCKGWVGCDQETGGWWNVTNDPFDESQGESPLWAFTKYRALNRLALRTKLGVSGNAGALAYLKHDSMGPFGDAAVMVFNPGETGNVHATKASMISPCCTANTRLLPESATALAAAAVWSVLGRHTAHATSSAQTTMQP